MRTVGLYIVALFLGSFVVRFFWQVVEQLFGVVTGPAALALTFASIAGLVVGTAYIFSVLAAPKPSRSRRRGLR